MYYIFIYSSWLVSILEDQTQEESDMIFDPNRDGRNER